MSAQRRTPRPEMAAGDDSAKQWYYIIAFSDNTNPAHLMDGGKILFAKVTSKQLLDDWLRIKIQVFLRDL